MSFLETALALDGNGKAMGELLSCGGLRFLVLAWLLVPFLSGWLQDPHA